MGKTVSMIIIHLSFTRLKFSQLPKLNHQNNRNGGGACIFFHDSVSFQIRRNLNISDED